MNKNSILAIVVSQCVFIGLILSYIEFDNNYRELSPVGYSNIIEMISEFPKDEQFLHLVRSNFQNDYISVGEFRSILDEYNSLHGTFTGNTSTELSITESRAKLKIILGPISI